jgi:hypothetical protein
VKISNTSRYPSVVVRALVLFAARELEVTGYVREVEVVGTRRGEVFRGWCYGRRVNIQVGPPERFPHHRAPYRAGAPEYDIRDWQEGIVQVAGHEFTHSRQFMRRVTRHSEVEAERGALAVLHVFRERREEVLGPALAAAEVAGVRRAAAEVGRPSDSELRVALLEERIKRWTTRRKRAETAIRKYGRELARLRARDLERRK